MRTLFWIAVVLAIAWWLLTCDCEGECQRRKRGADHSPIATAPHGNGSGAVATPAGNGCEGSLW